MKKLTIEDEQLKTIAAIHESIPSGYKEWHVSSMDLALRFESMKLLMMHNGDEIIAVVDKEDVIAFIWYVINDETMIKSLWVTPARRRQGIATELKDYVRQQSLAAGVTVIRSHVHPLNSKMRQLNEKLGYSHRGNEMIYKLEVHND
ncbi:GNAT family N-acetyltransferase [Macrococcus equipercicus]|nr:GNAT family N-acetyltransferase [Macrococcus equipercicus]